MVPDELSDTALVRARRTSVVGYDLKPHGPGVARLRFGDIGKPNEDRWINARSVAVALELLIDHRERASGFSEAFAQDEVRLIIQLAAPKIVQQSDRLVSEPPHVSRLRLPCAVGWFLLHSRFDRIRAELRSFFINAQTIAFKTATADVVRRRF